MPPRNAHVLFVHGVGEHSRLSSLLRAYQAVRSNLNSQEAPIEYEDPIPNWRLAEFNDCAAPPYLRLVPRFPGNQPGPSESIYFFEVNYSALAGVIRKNQPLDLARLFVGLDLAINVARMRSRKFRPGQAAIDHLAMARQVQSLSGVLVAATVPILGIPSLILRRYTQSVVATFSRFFEDIATFALDKNGEQLISAHVDKTVASIVGSPRFKPAEETRPRDELVMVAHSLGTVVTHNYVVRHWPGGSEVPRRVLSFGSPIGIVCWMWLFLDFRVFDFSRPRGKGYRYFCWTPETSEPPRPALNPPIQWINLVNYMDPIATAFPFDHVNLAQTQDELRKSFEGNAVGQRFIKTGGAFSAVSAHTDYFNDRRGFLEVLGRLIGIRPGDPAQPTPDMARSPAEHWQDMVRDLELLRGVLWAGGMACILAYLGVIGHACGTWEVLWFAPLYSMPVLCVGWLAFFQRLFFGGPTKRTSPRRLAALPWRGITTFPYRLRRLFVKEDVKPLASGPGLTTRFLKNVLAFLPTLVLMSIPLAAGLHLSEQQIPFAAFVQEHYLLLLPLMILFAGYLVLFALNRFVRHWIAIIELATAGS